MTTLLHFVLPAMLACNVLVLINAYLQANRLSHYQTSHG